MLCSCHDRPYLESCPFVSLSVRLVCAPTSRAKGVRILKLPIFSLKVKYWGDHTSRASRKWCISYVHVYLCLALHALVDRPDHTSWVTLALWGTLRAVQWVTGRMDGRLHVSTRLLWRMITDDVRGCLCCHSSALHNDWWSLERVGNSSDQRNGERSRHHQPLQSQDRIMDHVA